MKHVSVVFSCCYGCPFCDHNVEVHDGKPTNAYWCQKLQTNAHSSWWGEDRVLPGCPLDEYEPRDGDQIDKYYHLIRKERKEYSMEASNHGRRELWVKFALSCHLDPEYFYADGWAQEVSKYADMMLDEYTKRFGTHLSTDVTEVEKASDDT